MRLSVCLYPALCIVTLHVPSPVPSLFHDLHGAAKTLPLICKEAAETQSDSSGWVDGWGIEREGEGDFCSLVGNDFPLFLAM